MNKCGVEMIDVDLHKAEIGGLILADVCEFPLNLQNAVDPDVQTCRVCGCTNDDCSQCIKALGHACHWVAPNLCGRCEDMELFL